MNYKITIQIEGELSSPAFEIGGFLSAYAQAETRLTDLTSGEQVILRWEAGKQDTGMFSTSIDTVVGHTLGLSASVARFFRAKRQLPPEGSEKPCLI